MVLKNKCFSYRSYSQATHERRSKTSAPHIFVKNELRDINNSILNVSI